MQVQRRSLLEIITLHNSKRYEIVKDQNGKWQLVKNHVHVNTVTKSESVQTSKAATYYQNVHMQTPMMPAQHQTQHQYPQYQYQYQQLWQQQNYIQSQCAFGHYVRFIVCCCFRRCIHLF